MIIRLSVAIPHAHVSALLRLRLLFSSFRVVLIPQVVRTEAAITVLDSLFKLWDNILFDV